MTRAELSYLNTWADRLGATFEVSGPAQTDWGNRITDPIVAYAENITEGLHELGHVAELVNQTQAERDASVRMAQRDNSPFVMLFGVSAERLEVEARAWRWAIDRAEQDGIALDVAEMTQALASYYQGAAPETLDETQLFSEMATQYDVANVEHAEQH